MSSIKNREQLIANGDNRLDRRARRLALESLEAALQAADPRQLLKSRLAIDGHTLVIDELCFDLEKLKNVYVVGGGKASGSMAEEIERILGRHLAAGFVNVPYGCNNQTGIIELHGASHPVPDESGVEGTRRMLDIVEQAESDDLIICLISGGGSSLMPLPRDNVSLADKREMTQELLKSGATINEVNTVRKHISDFKGGWLAKKAYPATILNLILSDVVGDPLEFIASGPTVPDSTTFSDAWNVLRKYKLLNTAPESVKKLLLEGEKGLIPETPKPGDEAFKKVYNVVVGNNRSSSLAARNRFEKLRLRSLMLTATMEGEAKHVGRLLASIASEIGISGNPIPKPAGIISGGETTVTVTGKGLGGRNQELALAASFRLAGCRGTALASLSTDGIDGPTDAAGAIVDGKTICRALKKGLVADKFLAENDSYHFFSEIDDLIMTGPTGTNVNDLSIIVVL